MAIIPRLKAAEQSEAEGVYFVESYKPIILHRPVGVANLATRRPLVRSTLGFPRGEAAERSEADEGWRQVGL